EMQSMPRRRKSTSMRCGSTARSPRGGSHKPARSSPRATKTRRASRSRRWKSRPPIFRARRNFALKSMDAKQLRLLLQRVNRWGVVGLAGDFGHDLGVDDLAVFVEHKHAAGEQLQLFDEHAVGFAERTSLVVAAVAQALNTFD